MEAGLAAVARPGLGGRAAVNVAKAVDTAVAMAVLVAAATVAEVEDVEAAMEGRVVEAAETAAAVLVASTSRRLRT